MNQQKKRIANYQYDVFLSHSAKDGEFASQLATSLAEAGLHVWLDRWNIRPGESFAQAIDEAVKDSRFLLVVMSPDYFQSRWTQQEMKYALGSELESGGVRLIPLLYRDCEIPPMLRTKVWVDFRDPAQYRIVLDRLVRDLKSLASRQVSPGTPSVTEAPKSGERVENLDPSAIAQLQKCSTTRSTPSELNPTPMLLPPRIFVRQVLKTTSVSS